MKNGTVVYAVDMKGGRCLMHRPPVTLDFLIIFPDDLYRHDPGQFFAFSSGWLQPA